MKKWYTEKTIELQKVVLQDFLEDWPEKESAYLCVLDEYSTLLSVSTDDVAIARIDNLQGGDAYYSWARNLMIDYFDFGDKEYLFRFSKISRGFLIRAKCSFEDILDLAKKGNTGRITIVDKTNLLVLNFFQDEYFDSLYVRVSGEINRLEFKVLTKIID